MDERKAARLALGNVLRFGIDDVFPVPFEIDLLRKNKHLQAKILGDVERSLRSKSFDGLGLGVPYYVLQPKTKPFDFRRCALLQPIDAIKYLALALLAAPKIEEHRISTRKRCVFSYRFKPRGRFLFSRAFTYARFGKLRRAG